MTVEDFQMRRSADDVQPGGFTHIGHSRWSIRENVLSDAHGGDVALHGARNNRLVGNDIFRGGQEGVNGEPLRQRGAR